MGNFSGIDWNGDGKNDLLDDMIDMQLMEEMDSDMEDRRSGSGGGCGCGWWLFIIIGIILLFMGC